MAKLKQSLYQATGDQDYMNSKYPEHNPLTGKGKKVLESMRKTYGNDKKAKKVFYASINAGKKGSSKWHGKKK